MAKWVIMREVIQAVGVQAYRVEAESAEEALKKHVAGDGELMWETFEPNKFILADVAREQ